MPEKLQSQPRVVAPASTVLLVSKDEQRDSSELQGITESNIPSDAHYVDLTVPDTVVVMSQPPGQSCAILGGIMGLRMKKRGACAVVAGGRVRDLTELRGLDLPVRTSCGDHRRPLRTDMCGQVWALATSTVGTGLAAKPWAIGVPIIVQGVKITPVCFT